MTAQRVTVPPGLSIADLVESYVYHYHHKLFPVTEEGRLLGCVTTREVKTVPREEMEPRHAVGTVTQPCSPENSVGPETDALQALATMRGTGRARLMVVADGRLVGIVTLKDLLHFLALKVELER